MTQTMATILARKCPTDFKTFAIEVHATKQQLSYQAIGAALNFAQMQARRQPVVIADSQHFNLQLANLGVSVRLTLNWQGRDYLLLVRQQRKDRGDSVLKLISGYVPDDQLSTPLSTALQELTEECLIASREGWLGARFEQKSLPRPYLASLNYTDQQHFDLQAETDSPQVIYHQDQVLTARPSAYVHVPTASLQLVYHWRLSLPSQANALSLYHTDEQLEGTELITRLDPQQPDLYLIALNSGRANGDIYSLQQGQLVPVNSDNLWLSEAFAEQDGWLIRDERISWQAWLNQQHV
jgi:hypothetical protein